MTREAADIATGVRRYLPDALGLILALVLAAPSLAYPLGADQALHAYLGWGILEGEVPYATGGISTKPPLTFAVYALAFLLFGRTVWAIRVMEVAFLLAFAAAAARLVRPPGAAYRPGDLGALALLAVAAHFVFFDFWATARPDLWQGLLLAGAASLLSMTPLGMRRVLAAGVLCGFAFMLKFNAAVAAVLFAAPAIARAARARPPGARLAALVRLTAALTAGGALAVAITLAPFALTGTLASVYEVLVDFAVRFYLRDAAAGPPPSEMTTWPVKMGGIYVHGAAAAGLVLGGLVQRRTPGGPWRTLFLALAMGGALASVALQHRWLTYYWTAVTPFAVLGIGWGLRAITRTGWAMVAGSALLTAGALSVHPTWWPGGYDEQARAVVAQVRGTASADAYLKRFAGPWGFGWRHAVALGETVRRSAKPGDALCVWAFQPEAYFTTGLRCPSRLQVMTPEFERYASWREEHIGAIRTHHPRFLLASPNNGQVEDLGYRRVEAFGSLALYERAP